MRAIRLLVVALVVIALIPAAEASPRRNPCPLNVVPRDPGWTSIAAPEFGLHPAGVGDPSYSGIRNFAVPADLPSTIFASSDEELYRSDDGGCSWKPITVADAATAEIGRISDLDVTPDGKTIYVQAWPANASVTQLVFVSRDGGNTWDDLSAAEPALGAGEGELVIAPGDPRTVYAVRTALLAGTVSLLRSGDAGATWESVAAPGAPQVTPQRGSLAVSTLDPNELWAAVMFHEGTQWANFGLGHSTDGGKTWDLIRNPLQGPGSLPSVAVGTEPGQPARI
ncbi:MAG TPA: hypothetical protein VFK89_10580, partial [Actinomycetota bacterium]|nr:hypothetical protein [Actinomycetota bacterium]